MNFESIIIIRDKTRLEQLIERFNSKAQAKFYIESSGGDFNHLEEEHQQFYASLEILKTSVPKGLKLKIIQRSFLPTYIFTEMDIIVVIGQDGLVANTAKYVNGLPIVGINPDMERYDGILLKHRPEAFSGLMKQMMNGPFDTVQVTMAKATLNDGQSLLAFNDFYIGADSHVSSRYKISFDNREEQQSSSGIIVSTGAGSTGWLSSVFNMANNINIHHHRNPDLYSNILEWNADQLIFVVREPFLSKMSQTTIGYGIITKEAPLTIESQMPTKGIIFSDGIEADYLNFNSGSTVEISIANEKANLVV
ncbi:sugar kinase [Winogradskyella sp.]|uniref:sugar kinase n=1 Tax=Winogradskyella sp. TaxID=1883156 RepID=UPI003BAB0E07